MTHMIVMHIGGLARFHPEKERQQTTLETLIAGKQSLSLDVKPVGLIAN